MEKGGEAEEESRVQRACFTVIRDPHGWDIGRGPSGEFGGNLSHHAPIIRQSKSHDYTNVFIVGWRAKKVLLFIPLWIGSCHLQSVEIKELLGTQILREINFSQFGRPKNSYKCIVIFKGFKITFW